MPPALNQEAALNTLAGLRVVDLSQNLAGPFCTQILGDLGADVIKVEPPGRGDPARDWGPPAWDGLPSIFLVANRNKRSIAIDLKTDDGKRVLERLIASADVFVESFRAGVAQRLGFAAAAVRERHPELIYCSITAYGADGPLREQPGYDPLMQAHGGLMSVTGRPDDPVRAGTSVVDMGTGMWAALGVMAALRERERTGHGTHVVASLYESTLMWNAYHLMGHWATGDVPGPLGTSFPLISPYGAFPTADGKLMIAAANDGLFQALCKVLELSAHAQDPRYATNPVRVENRHTLDADVATATARHSTAALRTRLTEAGVPNAPIHDMAQVAAEPQTHATGLVDDTPHPRAEGYKGVRTPLQWDGRRATTRRVPPVAGEHTHDVLAEIGIGEEEASRLVERGILGAASAAETKTRRS